MALKTPKLAIILALVLSPYIAMANASGACSESNFDFVMTKLNGNELADNGLTHEEFSKTDPKPSAVCEIKNDLMSDGLAFTVYKESADTQFYISVYNGVNGSVKYFGPFEH
ncbi:hypothetical protein FE810_13100 [Thalassotalea litorea]|uniref:DUF3718 domain-containing protein n=1 Tax=Thalassotalea litorea TaxID=2020715 RepID=A0A5R9IPS6_9GAMM|nr:hypothetical protein [Thalassotalea litorea]TLU61989.1 hypothetical protein FE810_13100 [Thalassotalea litorea]